MKTVASITPIDSRDIDRALFDRIVSVYPEGRRYNENTGSDWFSLRLDVTDSRLARVTKQFESAGWRPWADHFRPPQEREFDIVFERVYDVQDWIDSKYLEPAPEICSEEIDRNPEGKMQLDFAALNLRRDFIYTSTFAIIVSTRVKDAVVASSATKGVAFRPTTVMKLVDYPQREPVDWSEIGPPYWELTSNLHLPPLAPSCKLVDRDGAPFNGDYSKGCYIVEGLFQIAELHYTTSSLAAAEPFDAALTFEKLGINARETDRRLVVSKRFYQTCVDAGIQMQWRPVRIDPD